MARSAGASQVIVSGTSADAARLKVSEGLGAEVTIDSEKENACEVVRELTDGLGADLVADCAGSSTTLKQSLEMVRRLGQITKVGRGPMPVDFSLDLLLIKSATLQGTYGHHWRIWSQVLRMMQRGRIDFATLISDVLPITEWERAYQMVESREGVKVILTPVD